VFCGAIYVEIYAHRYFGDVSWAEVFRRMSFDRPEFVTPAGYFTVAVLLIAALAAFAALMAVAARRARAAGCRPYDAALMVDGEVRATPRQSD
jgi:uncharacterized membrane protein YhaH (DUF805 family)